MTGLNRILLCFDNSSKITKCIFSLFMIFIDIPLQIYVAGHNISTDLDDAFQNLGYCPQHDALWELVTLKEHLKCYALLKGVPKNRVDTLVRQ